MKKVASVIGAILISLTLIPEETNAIRDFSSIGEVRTKLPEENNITACINDNKGHGDIVEKFVKKYYDGKTELLLMSDYNTTNPSHYSKYSHCDTLNLSIGRIPVFFGFKPADLERKKLEFKEKEYSGLEDFLSIYDGIIVSSAGNEDEDTTFSTDIARYKEKAKKVGNTKHLDRLFVVGQIENYEDGSYKHRYSYGEEIDFMVANYNEKLLGMEERHSGTSFAAPVATALISQMLQAGVPQEEIRNVLAFEDELHTHNGRSYKVLSVFKTIKSTYDYIGKHK